MAGYGHGATVALLIENRPAFFWHWFALNALGVAILPINPDLQPDDLAHQFSVAEPDLAVALSEHQDLIRAAGMSEARIITPDMRSPTLRSEGVDREYGERDDPCALLFTSGTTGKPKCCVLSNDYFIRLARWYINQGGAAAMREAQEIILTPLPLFHMNALACSALGAILLKSTLVPLDRFHARSWWKTVADSGATIVHYLGVMPAILLKLPEEPAERAHRIRFGFGAGVDPRHQVAFEERFGFPLIEAWAMTETGGGAVTTTAGGDRHVGERCIGYPAPGMEYRIVDDNGADAPDGQPGELLVRAKGDQPRQGFFTSYLKDPEATDQAWAGGWFHTGDVVRKGPDGALYFVDRKKNIVRRSGENIAVVEVEGVLQNLDEVAGVAVAPVPDDIRGEEVFALVKLHAGVPDLTGCASESGSKSLAPARSNSPITRFQATSPSWSIFRPPQPKSCSGPRSGVLPNLPCRIPATVDLRNLKGQLRLAKSA